ncbi:MAG TPA: transposase [Candidatus Sulfotelmatobacter sp.]|nr:transposase [Candidatus Sulfotelmatobacter sp.]
MSQEKYIGMDVHQATICAAVVDAQGKVLMECALETKASTIIEFVQGLQGTLSLTFEEGTWAAWLHDLLKPHVSRLVVCDPRKAALLKEGNKSDRIDARKLAEMLRTNQLRPVYHEEHGLRTLKELGRCYLTLNKDVTRTMNRIKSLYRSWAIPCQGSSVYAPRKARRVAGQDRRTGSANASRVFVSATGRSATAASSSATRATTREPQACGGPAPPSDSFDWSDPSGLAGGLAADPSPFSQQAPVVGLQWFRCGNSR